MNAWKIWVDTGGTFTDCIAYSPDQKIKRLKVLSHGVMKGEVTRQLSPTSFLTSLSWPTKNDIYRGFSIRFFDSKGTRGKVEKIDIPNQTVYLSNPVVEIRGCSFEISSEEEVPVFATRLLTETGLLDSFPPIELKLGSTRGTNALLERKGAHTALLITKGFKDLLEIGTQQRPDLFALEVIKEKPLYDWVFEINERIESDGSVHIPLDLTEIESLALELKGIPCESIAIALVNSYKNPAHELQLKATLQKLGFSFVSISTEVSRQIKILPRAETVVANAYLNPIIRNYVQGIQEKLQHAQFKIMTSAGGLVNAGQFFPKDSLLSGPAGGVVGAVTAARLSGEDRIITFDMGGTSTDVSLVNKQYTYRYESKVGAARILSPSLAIETIAAGGGSICDFDGHKLIVGPHSAGAFPGPACYGSGGPLTITDVNLLLGRTHPELFTIPLFRAHSERALKRVLDKMRTASGKAPSPHAVLQSFIQIANEKMAEAIRKVSIQQGHDPADYALLSFGGAGGQHACALAQLLGMRKMIIPYDAGLLSAYGIGHANISHFEEQLVLGSFEEVEPQLAKYQDELFKRGQKKLEADGYPEREVLLELVMLFMRFKGQESTIEVPYKKGNLYAAFRRRYVSLYGHWLANRLIEVESIRVILKVRGASPKSKRVRARSHQPQAHRKAKVFYYNSWKEASLYQWESLQPGARLMGPALVISGNSTTVIDPGWQFQLDENNHAILRKQSDERLQRSRHGKEAALELFSNRFTAIAQEMGALLQRTAFSVNVKERLDFSCALMDAQGYLVVNAPHIPVHLGSMGVCVREVLKVLPLKPGDVAITNHPAFGGSHLPDVTLIKPVYNKHKLIGFVAVRAHHAEIGGMKPGSMPAHASTLAEEGIIIKPMYLVKAGKPQWSKIREVLTSGPYPTRLPEENLADLNGALAAITLGEKGLMELSRQHSIRETTFYMKALRAYAATLLRQQLKLSKSKVFQATEKLDDGSVLRVHIMIKPAQLWIDFTGTSPVHAGNLNATPAIVQSVILYVLRLWVNKPIAMNEGLMDPVKFILPVGMLNPEFTGSNLPAVVGGNTEVSQRLTDTLLKALGLVACSQGTMNNFLFGNERFGFYETICGGTGAGSGFNGTDAVHSHMTNTRITDPEILELRYPVRLDRFEIRRGSGGWGRWKGGNGVIRAVTFKEKVEVNLLCQHRTVPPYGLAGGAPGACGEQQLIRSGGSSIPLSGMTSIEAQPGDQVVLMTPGGGGYGKQKAPSKLGL